jgi:hypothetical protein
MPRYTTRRLEVFALHARLTKGRVNYDSLFQAFANLPDEQRVFTVGDKLVAIPMLTFQDGYVWFRAVEGDKSLHPLIYNYENGTARIERLRTGEMVATRTHGLINLERREAIIEYNQIGAKASDVSLTLEHVGRIRTQWTSLKVEFTPKVDQEFIDSINRFERIRVASFKVARPNPSWEQDYEHLSEVAEDSNARYMELTMTAERNESLSARRGIISYIKSMARLTTSHIKGANITGVRQGESSETSVSLNRYIEHQKVRVRRTEEGHVEDADVERRIADYMSIRDERS